MKIIKKMKKKNTREALHSAIEYEGEKWEKKAKKHTHRVNGLGGYGLWLVKSNKIPLKEKHWEK